ncbi:MAG: hypothetical protein IMW91_02170 [Firmicutes bacterium]|nr:hypothetical protein [Bacillota bacterium]
MWEGDPGFSYYLRWLRQAGPLASYLSQEPFWEWELPQECSQIALGQADSADSPVAGVVRRDARTLWILPLEAASAVQSIRQWAREGGVVPLLVPHPATLRTPEMRQWQQALWLSSAVLPHSAFPSQGVLLLVAAKRGPNETFRTLGPQDMPPDFLLAAMGMDRAFFFEPLGDDLTMYARYLQDSGVTVRVIQSFK